ARITAALGIHDTCGVHNLHGMPAVLSAIASAIFANFVTQENYKSELGAIFPAMVGAPENSNSTIILGGYNRTASTQAGYQLCGIAVTLLVAIVGGVLTGAALKYTSVRKLQKDEQHQDELFWEVPENKED
ncbi:PREDICTED: ammonium transporter Rh type B-like, partial [Rhagoletis zephyria]|uniref:ammonium transporter Rh type B-like n=1 Tax=Rhagoletis zephyria TaxID=28612 RepID=UPI0008115F90